MRLERHPRIRLLLTAALATAAIGGACRDPYFERGYARDRDAWRKEGIPDKDMPSYDQWLRGHVPGRGKDKGKLVDTGALTMKNPITSDERPAGAGGEGGGGEGGH